MIEPRGYGRCDDAAAACEAAIARSANETEHEYLRSRRGALGVG